MYSDGDSEDLDFAEMTKCKQEFEKYAATAVLATPAPATVPSPPAPIKKIQYTEAERKALKPSGKVTNFMTKFTVKDTKRRSCSLSLYI